jgi:hypothetical protein
VRNDSSSLVATDVQRLNAGCEDSASPASFSVGGAKLLAPLGIPDIFFTSELGVVLLPDLPIGIFYYLLPALKLANLF